MKLSTLEKKVLTMAQNNFPIAEKPYEKIAKKLKITEEEAVEIFKKLKKKGVIMRVTPSFKLEKINYKSVLAAAKVPKPEIRKFSGFVNKFREVTHNFLRAGEYNIWFTVIAPNFTRIKNIKNRIEKKFNLKILLIPGVKKYKRKFTLTY